MRLGGGPGARKIFSGTTSGIGPLVRPYGRERFLFTFVKVPPPMYKPRFMIAPAGLASALAAASLLAMPPAHAQVASPAPGAAAPVLRLSIAAQPLGQALNELARQARLELIVAPGLVTGKMAPAVSGALSVQDALHRLLAGSGLAAQVEGANVFIRRAAEPQAGGATLPPVTVTAPPLQEQARGPVQGYVAQRSATASKTDSAILDTPLSVHVVGREQIESQGAQRIQQALRYTPGVSSDIRGDISRFDQLAFRGTGAVATDTFQYLDGLRLPRGVSYLIPQIDPYNLERVEVLKGPASVLYGQAPLGGIVSLVGKRPVQERLREVNISVGSHQRVQAGFDAGGALNADGTLSYRLTALARKADTPVQLTQEERVSIAPAITWSPDADTALTVLASYQHDPTGSYYGVLPSSGTILPNPYGPIARDFFDGSPDFNAFNRTQASLGYELRHRLAGVWTLHQNMRYWHMDLDQSQVGTSTLLPDSRTLARYALWSRERLNAVNLDTRIQGEATAGALTHQLVFGLDLQRDHWTQTQGFGAAPALDLLAPDYGQAITRPGATTSPDRVQKLAGLYVQDQIKAGAWNWILGLRADHADIRIDNALSGRDTRQSFTKYTGRLGAIRKFDNGIAPYASYATSFDPTVTLNPYGDPFAPTTGRQYEFGLKYQPPGTTQLYTLAAFDLTQKNVLTRDPNATLPNAMVQTGEVNSRGLEFEARLSPARGFNLIGGLSVLDPKVTKSNGADLNKRPVSVARATASVWADYRLRGGPLAGLTLGGGVRHVGTAYADPANTQRIPAYTVADAMLRYELGQLEPALSGATLALNVSNLFDKAYFTCNAPNFCNYGQGRTLLATLNVKW